MKHLMAGGPLRWPERHKEIGKKPGRSAGGRQRQRSAYAAQTSTVEKATNLPAHIEDAINASLLSCLEQTDLKCAYKSKNVGKVRDTYDLGDKMIFVTTDRQSAFDRMLAVIPFKGQVLNQTSAWWMRKTEHLVPNALVSTPDPNVSIMQKCDVFPVEIVVRGYMTGSTDTSLWTHYNQGLREYCGNTFPDGLRKNDRLAENVITPTTKSEEHDVPISAAEIVQQGLMSQADWDQVCAAALKLFEFGQEEAQRKGLLLVDTKYEFGKTQDGQILLIDEVHTPDSSRYWISNTYQERHSARQEPQNIDKEFIRLWFRGHCDPYKDKVLPEAPSDLVKELSRRYILLYNLITRSSFEPALGASVMDRINQNLQSVGIL